MEKRNDKKVNKLSSRKPQRYTDVKSNHGSSLPYDNVDDQRRSNPEYFKNKKEGYCRVTEPDKTVTFKRSMTSKKVRLELFMLEEIEDFENRTLRPKMQTVINRSCEELKELFFEKGIENDLPRNWEEFNCLLKISVVNKE
jgi:hypothetical protein